MERCNPCIKEAYMPSDSLSQRWFIPGWWGNCVGKYNVTLHSSETALVRVISGMLRITVQFK